MTVPEQAPLSVEDFVQQVAQACSDLPDTQRRRIMADLDDHLRELVGHPDVIASLGSPTDYARDLREAMAIPATAATPSPVPRRRRSPMLLLGLGVVVAISLAAIAIVVASRSRTGRTPAAHTSNPAAIASASSATVAVPYLVGLTVTTAEHMLQTVGLRVQVTASVITNPSVISGEVGSQLPPPLTIVVKGSTVTIGIGRDH